MSDHIDVPESVDSLSDRLAQRLASSPLRLSTGWGVFLGVLGSLAIGVVDAITAPGIVFVMPLALVTAAIAWFSTNRAWVLTVILGLTVWTFVSLSGRPIGSVPIEVVTLLVRVSVLGTLGFFSHQLRRAVERERELAVRDDLTGLFNRRGFFEIAERELARARRDGLPVTIAAMDLDDFKRVNDTRGHHVGDLVLEDFARRVSQRVRAIDVFARTGGDEFVLLLLADEAEAANVIAAIEHLPHDPELPSVSCSVGAVTFHVPPASLDAALTEADSRMYENKRSALVSRRVRGSVGTEVTS